MLFVWSVYPLETQVLFLHDSMWQQLFEVQQKHVALAYWLVLQCSSSWLRPHLNSSLIIQAYGLMTIKHNCVWISPSEALYLPGMQFPEMRNESWPWCLWCSNLKQEQRNGNFLMLAETLKSGLLFLEYWKNYCSIIIEPKHKWCSLRWLTHKLLLFQRSCNFNLQGKHH